MYTLGTYPGLRRYSSMDGWDRSDGLDSARPHGQAGQGPLDLWLKRELSKRYDATLDECLPETWLRLLTGTKGRR